MKFKNIIIFSIKKYFFIFTFLFCYASLSAQNCKNLENNCPRPKDKKFLKSGMSHSGKIKPKQKKTYNLSLLEGKEYYISLCGESVKGNLQLRILSGENKLIYDNAAAGLIDNFTIRAEITQKIILEVTAPLGTLSDDKIACLGIYVASRKFDNSH